MSALQKMMGWIVDRSALRHLKGASVEYTRQELHLLVFFGSLALW